MVLALLFLCEEPRAQAYFDYNAEVEEAYADILRLDTRTAQARLDRLKSSEPNNLAALHIENYIDFFTVFLKEEKSDLDQFSERKAERLRILSQGEESPFLRFAQAEVHLQYALARSKFGQYVRAGWDIHKANKLLLQNRELYPNFSLNNKSLSIIHSLMGSLKGLQRSIILLFTSLDGDVEQGVKEIETLYNSPSTLEADLFSTEVLAIRALIAHHVEKDGARAIKIITKPDRPIIDSPLLDFVKASILLLNQKESEAIPLLERITTRSKELSFDYPHLMLGICRLHQLDPDSKEAILYFIEHFEGRHYIKEAYQKLAWYELLLKEDEVEYQRLMAKCLVVGHQDLGEDQQAQREAESGLVPNADLLSARVLSDGGYFNRALLLINHIDTNHLNIADRTEYHYRLGRIYQGIGQNEKALRAFMTILKEDIKDKRYFICNAALQSGVIYFNNGQPQNAKRLFEKCLSIKPEEHQNSLHQKAKSWLDKIEADKKSHH